MAKVELDHEGIGEMLKSYPVRQEVMGAARQIAAHVEASFPELPVEVHAYTTDRAAASVVIAHPAGLAVQAKHGALTRAASAEGLEVTER
jgi:hypothetical protein